MLVLSWRFSCWEMTGDGLTRCAVCDVSHGTVAVTDRIYFFAEAHPRLRELCPEPKRKVPLDGRCTVGVPQ